MTRFEQVRDDGDRRELDSWLKLPSPSVFVEEGKHFVWGAAGITPQVLIAPPERSDHSIGQVDIGVALEEGVYLRGVRASD